MTISSTLPLHEFGDRQAPTIFLLHAGGALHSIWLPLIRAWSNHYHLIAPDLIQPNHQVSLQNLAEELIEVIPQHSSKPVWLVGSSLGANVALLVATQASHLVAGLILDSAQVGGTPPAMLPPLIRFLKVVMWVMPQSLVTNLLMRQFSVYPLVDQPAIRAEVETVGKTGFLQQIEAHFVYDVRHALPNIAVPTLIIAGADDMLTKAQEPHKLQTRIKAAVLEVIPQAGHVTFLQQPELFQQLATEFLKQHLST